MSAESISDTSSPSSCLTLAVTSSTGVVGMALGRVATSDNRFSDVDILACCQLETERRHAEELSPGLQALLADADCQFADLEKLVVDVGPGRFTGLRVGLATIKGLAFALELPVVGLVSLEILAGAEPTGPVTAVIDARREEVFQQRFTNGVAVGDLVVGSASNLASVALGRTVGDGADRYVDSYSDRPEITVIAGRNPDATVMLSLSGRFPGRPGAEVEPLYGRDPDVNPNIKTRPTSSTSPSAQSQNGSPKGLQSVDSS